MRRTLLLLMVLAGCSKSEELEPFAVNTPVRKCPLCRSPAYLSEVRYGHNYFECGRHRMNVDGRGEIWIAQEFDNPRMRARIAKFGILKPDFGGVRVEKVTD